MANFIIMDSYLPRVFDKAHKIRGLFRINIAQTVTLRRREE
jgi:hypothetical protein